MRKLILLTLCLSFHSQAERWDFNNDPVYFNKIIDTSIISQFDLLPLEGKLDDERLGWSETYWPSNKGGIAFRWNHPEPMPFRYAFHTKEEIKKMSLKELSRLSPAELYDIAQGDYRYTLTRKTLGLFSPTDLWWEGVCHGWAQAAANYPEPRQVVVRNPDGIRVPFGASDVKGLLSMHDAYNSVGTYAHIGGRCSAPGKVPGEASSRDGDVPMPTPEEAETSECKDVNAGAFHIILTNMIGIQSKGIVADVDRFNDVWNQPVVSYESYLEDELPVSSEELFQGVVKKVHLRTKMIYGEELQFFSTEAEERGELNFVSKTPVTRTPHQAYRFKEYEYVLELDGAGKIVGGEWISITRPDFIWIKRRDKKFQNSPIPLGGLGRIYKPVSY